MAEDSHKGIADAFVAAIFAAGADKGFRSLDVFVTWFVAGSAAAIGLAAGNLDRLQWLITPTRVQAGLPLFGAILTLVLLSKFFGSLICTLAGSMDAAMGVMRRFDEIHVPIVDPVAFEAALSRATPWPLRLVGWVWMKVTGRRKPNLGKVVTWLLMGSGFCAILAAGLTVWFWVELLAK